MQLTTNPFFSNFAQRAISRTYYEGADLGECLTTSQRFGNGGADDWYREWMTTADRLANIAASCFANQHFISARDAWLRATSYYHVSYLPLFGKPMDTRLKIAFEKETTCFQKAAALFSPAIEMLEIPYENITLPAYFVKVDESGKPRPTMVHTNGYDSNIQEMYFNHAAAAIRRGYNCLMFDGPGQGRTLIRDGIPMRHDWENVVRPVIDYALSRSEIDPKKIVLTGWSFGGFLAPRAAAFEHRIAALVADPGQWDLIDAIRKNFPLTDEEKLKLPDIDPEKIKFLEEHIRKIPALNWSIMQRAYWVNNVNNFSEFIKEMQKYNISSVVDGIQCPTLLTCAEGDVIAENAPVLFNALKCPKKLVSFSLAEGSGGHCEGLARSLYHQRVFDWLDEVLLKA